MKRILRLWAQIWPTIAWVLIFGITIVLCFDLFRPFEWTWGIQILGAILGGLITIIATRLLLSKQSEMDKESIESEKNAKRELEQYNAKLKVYSGFVYSMYEALSDNKITEKEMIDFRTKLLGEVAFYGHSNILNEITKELEKITDYSDERKMVSCFAAITSILQEDLQKDGFDPKIVINLWGQFEGIMANTNDENNGMESNTDAEERAHIAPYSSKEAITPIAPDNNKNEETINTPKRLEQQAWHFSMWGDEQLEKLKEGFNELSLVEYGEQWRTNLVKQIKKNDVIMLFRRGGYGYIGAYQAVGWRVFNFEENQEEILMFGKDSQIIEGEQYLSDIKKYDIYKSCDDGATSCTNIIVAPIAFVEDGVGNPGGVYRRTISRYDPHYAWLLKNEFQKTGQWLDR